MPAPHALYSKMLAERTASRNVLDLFYLVIYGQRLRPAVNDYDVLESDLLETTRTSSPLVY
jgi:hypothetical protein